MKGFIKKIVKFFIRLFKVVIENPKNLKYISIMNVHPFELGIPWINFSLKNWLDKNLNKNMIVFEYGSGGSSIYFSNNCKQVVSIEHNEKWFNDVNNKIIKLNIKNINLNLISPSNERDDFYATTDEELFNKNFKQYVHAIDNYPDNYFDVVFVDGRSRNACIRESIKKIKKGGFLILDNSERPEYSEGISLLDHFKCEKFFGMGFYNHYKWESRVWHIN